MSSWFEATLHNTSSGSAFATLLLAWQLWALLSELLLAATHLKVLLCIGKPIPAKELSSKRWTYFLYDLMSPWLSLASIVAPKALPVLVATLALHTSTLESNTTATFDAKTLPQQYGAGAASSLHHKPMGTSKFSRLLQDTCSPVPLLASASAAYCANNQPSVEPLSAAANSTAVVPPPASTQHQSMVPIRIPAQTTLLASQSPLQQLLLAFVAAHATLHVYYIVSWHTAHSRNVVEMSASSSMQSRAQQFSNLEVVWFFIGTGYDILTHVVISYLLVQNLLTRHTATLA